MSRRCSRSTTAVCSISCRRGHPTLQSARRSWPPIRRACTASQDRGLEAKAVIVRCGAGNWRRRRATTAHLGAAVGCGTTCGWGGKFHDLVSQHFGGGAQDVLGVLRRLVARCARSANVQSGHPGDHRDLAFEQDRGRLDRERHARCGFARRLARRRAGRPHRPDRKSTRLNSSHRTISYAALCLTKTTTTSDQDSSLNKKKKKKNKE